MDRDSETELQRTLRHELLDAIEMSVMERDYDAAIGLARGTDLLRAFEIVEYLDVKDRHCEDPGQQEIWRGVLSRYLGGLAGQEFPPEEQAVITDTARRLEFENMLEGGAMVSEEGALDIAEIESEVDAYGWDSDEFHVRLDPETVERVKATAVWQAVERFMKVGYRNGSYDLEHGHWIIMKLLHGSQREEALAVFDGNVFDDVHRSVADEYWHLSQPYWLPRLAKEEIDKFASSRAVALEMKRANDKYIFRAAERALKAENREPWRSTPQGNAVNIICMGASSRARRDAMMDRLGLDQRLLPYKERLPPGA